MSNFLALSQSQRDLVEDLNTQLIRVQIHIKRQELRAATKRLEIVFQELASLERRASLPTEYMLVGLNIGLLTGGRSILRGRVPAALLGAAAGWCFGQSVAHKNQRELHTIRDHALFLLDGIARQTSQPEPRAQESGTQD